MKRIKLQFPVVLCFIFVHFELASAGSLRQLWNKLKYENRLDYYQPYSSFNYLPSNINYPASLNNYNLMNAPVAESSNLHRTVVSLPSNNLQGNLPNGLQSNLQSNLPANNLPNNDVPNLMTAESISNQNYAVMSQMPPSIQHLSPEFLFDYAQKPPNGYSVDSMRNLNGLQSMNSGLSLTSLTPLLLLSSLGTLSSKSLAGHPLSHAGLTPAVSNGFLKGLTTYLSSYLPSSPRQRKRQIDRNLPPALSPNAYSFKKMVPIESYAFPPLAPLASQPKTSVSAFDASFKKYSHFNKKKPIKYTKPHWIDNKMNKKPYNAKKKNQIKYSKLMNETGFVSRPIGINSTDRFINASKLSGNKRTNNQINNQIKYSEPDKYADEKNNLTIEKQVTTASTNQDESNRSNDRHDKQEDKLVEKKSDGENLNEKSNEEASTAEEGQQRDSIEKNPPQTDNLEDILKSEKMYSEIIKRITSKSNDKHHQSSKE